MKFLAWVGLASLVAMITGAALGTLGALAPGIVHVVIKMALVGMATTLVWKAMTGAWTW